MNNPEGSKYLNPRLRFLRNAVFNWKNTQIAYIGQRLYGALQGLTTTYPSTPWMKKRAAIMKGIIDNSTPIIHPHELIVGYNYYGDDKTVHHEMGLNKREGSLLKNLKEYLEKGQLTPDQIEFILDVNDELDLMMPDPWHPTLEQPMDVAIATGEGLISAHGTAENHTIIGYSRVLKKGFRKILEEINSELNSLSWRDPNTPNKKLLLESAKMVVEAACEFGKKYALYAQNLLDSNHTAYNCDDLKKIIQVCSCVPEFPAKTLHEAVQALWFAHIFNTWEDFINANSIGRIDQILYPYYKADIEAGRLTKDEAFELIGCLWIKLYRDYDVQQACLGGVTENGSDATNELSYLMLDVTDALDFIRCLSVRLHRQTPPDFLEKSLAIVKKGQGIPFFFNDEVMVPALTHVGIDLIDARDYAAIGCVEIAIPGKSNPHAVSNWINLLKCLELALNDGKNITHNKQVGPKTGEISTFKSMDEIIHAYKIQVEYFIDLACFESNRKENENQLLVPMVYKSILTENCLKYGLDFNAGGAKYHYHESMAFGIPNVADSLEAIHTLVFEEKKYTLPEMVDILKSNFADEIDRQYFLNRSAKYGNDKERVDKYAAMVMEHFSLYLQNQKSPLGGKYLSQPFTFLWLVNAGLRTGATPDGRKAGENLAYSLSPMQGRDLTGLTAMINSLSKLPYTLAAGGPSAIIEVDPELFNEKNLPTMVKVIQTAIEKGVGQMQFNVITEATLREAQAHPDQYQNLAVRVSGFSQRFCLLDKNIQDHIIARTKHNKL